MVLAVAVLAVAGALAAQDEDSVMDPSPPAVPVREIVRRFAAQEQIFKEAYNHYTYREVVKMQTLGEQGYVDGEYDDTFDVTFDNQGNRVVKPVSHPRDTLKRIRVTQEDIDDLRDRMPFVLTSDELPSYKINYKGQQDASGTHCYVFDIAPKAMEEGRRYFEGRIWVDANAYQVVKSSGKAVPDIYNRSGENLFPKFTTFRELVDDKYWFPSYTRSNDTLFFSGGPVHIVEVVDYTNYKRFGAESKIIFDGQEVGNGQQSQPQTRNSQDQPDNRQPTGLPQQQRSERGPQQSQPQQQAASHPAPSPRQPVNPPPQPTELVQQSLITTEREIADAINNKDVSILERLLTDDFRLVRSTGDVRDKFALLNEIHQGRAASVSQPENLQARVTGDSAVVTGERQVSAASRTRANATTRVRFTDLFVRRAGEWFLTSSQETGITAK
jgi:ketosteroid isomerase-like protein